MQVVPRFAKLAGGRDALSAYVHAFKQGPQHAQLSGDLTCNEQFPKRVDSAKLSARARALNKFFCLSKSRILEAGLEPAISSLGGGRLIH